jgi:uncharacterized protein (DUF1015 family)
VPRFEPFRAIRYDLANETLDEVTAPPYDVLSDSDVDAYTARSEHNIVRIDVPRERDGDGRYAQAAALLDAWLADGTLVVDEVPSFTIYRMSYVDEAERARSTVGVLGALEVVDDGAGGVLPHERTTPKAKSDRLDLTRATGTNLSPVWGLSLADGLTSLLTEPGKAVGTVTADGVVHAVERVDDPERVAAIAAAVGAQPVVIADGHHRYAVSRAYRDEVRTATGRDDTPAELTLAYVAELVEEQLGIEAIHRLYRGLDASGLAAALEPFFESAPAGEVGPPITLAMAARGALCLVAPDGSGTYLRPREGAFEGVRDLDSARLEHALRGVDHEVSYQHGVGNVLDALADGSAEAAILIRPVSIAEIRRTADEGLLMPPKSTFFTPKLLTGLVERPLR